MKHLNVAFVVIMTVSFALASDAFAQSTRNSRAQVSHREAIKAQCVQEGAARTPSVHTPGQVSTRKSSYAACMHRHGLRP